MAFDIVGLKRGFTPIFVGLPHVNCTSWRYITTDTLADVLLQEELLDTSYQQTYFVPGGKLFQLGDTIWVDAYDGSQLMLMGNVIIGDPGNEYVEVGPVANISAL